MRFNSLRSIDTSSGIELARKNNNGHIQLKCVIAVLMFIPCASMAAAPSREVLPFVALSARTLVLTHVNVIDGAGAPPAARKCRRSKLASPRGFEPRFSP
jgi:hypothetical protein